VRKKFKIKSMDNPKKQVVDRIKQATNVLVTVSANPSVDQLAAAIGLTLLLNKLGKHGTAVFSGEVPSTIQFLEPEKTLEKNTDSLRDFIIALDKSKADKLRYKVEENVVKIFITPYKTSISEKDLDFSQGDFNVDVVLALGVRQQTDLDQAITSHGRILHDATVISINNGDGGELGSIHWLDKSASSLSEMAVLLGNDLGENLLDSQIATALLTGIVAETNRFSNNKTTPATMSVSSALMAAGANQQLVATKLQERPPEPPPQRSQGKKPSPSGSDGGPGTPPKNDDGTLEIDHQDAGSPASDMPADNHDGSDSSLSQIHVDDEGTLQNLTSPPPLAPLPPASQLPMPLPQPVPAPPKAADPDSRLMTGPPSFGGTLTASSQTGDNEPTTDPMSMPAFDTPFLSHDSAPQNTAPAAAASPAPQKSSLLDEETLTKIEKDVDSPHAQPTEVNEDQAAASTLPPPAPTELPVSEDAELDQARNAVQAAIVANPDAGSVSLPPIDSLNAQPVFEDLHETPAPTPAPEPLAPIAPLPPLNPNLSALPPIPPADEPLDTLNMPLPSISFPPNLVPPNPVTPVSSQTDTMANPSAPPPVPPPMMPFPPTNS
jgi:hypothetical protein